MPSTEYSKRGLVKEKISDKMRLFVDYYIIDLDATKAAIKAGYSVKTASAMGGKLLRDPRVKRAIGKASKEIHDNLELTAEIVLRQLYYVTTRDIREFVDANGVMIPINELDARAAACVDGFDQEITDYTDYETGNTTRTIKNKIKLVSKSGAIEMAMKYRGLFAPVETKQTNVMQFDFAKLLEAPSLEQDPVKNAMAALEETPHQSVTIEVKPNKKK